MLKIYYFFYFSSSGKQYHSHHFAPKNISFYASVFMFPSVEGKEIVAWCVLKPIDIEGGRFWENFKLYLNRVLKYISLIKCFMRVFIYAYAYVELYYKLYMYDYTTYITNSKSAFFAYSFSHLHFFIWL